MNIKKNKTINQNREITKMTLGRMLLNVMLLRMFTTQAMKRIPRRARVYATELPSWVATESPVCQRSRMDGVACNVVVVTEVDGMGVKKSVMISSIPVRE